LVEVCFAKHVARGPYALAFLWERFTLLHSWCSIFSESEELSHSMGLHKQFRATWQHVLLVRFAGSGSTICFITLHLQAFNVCFLFLLVLL